MTASAPGACGKTAATVRLLLAVRLVLLAALIGGGSQTLIAHDTHADGNRANDWIVKFRNARGESCCGGDDCTPLDAGAILALDNGGFRVAVDGTWFDVPAHAIVRDASPDGRPWVCPWLKEVPLGSRNFLPGGVRCLLLPMLS